MGGQQGSFPARPLADALMAAAARAGIGTTITVRRPDGRFEHAFVNDAALAINGYKREEFMQMPALGILAPGEAERLLAPNALPRGKDAVARVEAKIVHKSGELVPVEILIAYVPWNDEEGGEAIVSYFSDIRERRKAESAFRDHVARVDRLVALGTLAAGVAHEVNNPIAVTATSLEALSRLLTSQPERAIDADIRDRALALVTDARAGVDRVARIVRELRGLSREDEGQSPVDLDEVLAAAERLTRGVVQARAEVVRHAGEVSRVWGHPGRLEQVFVNLLVNAAQAMPSDRHGRGRIEIHTSESGGFVTIAVRDDGVGIAPEHLPRIFDPFFTTKPVGEGTGLGLALCHTIVTQFGGTILVESERDKGTVFRVQLPAFIDSVASVAKPSATSPEGTVDSAVTGDDGAGTNDARKARILVVDDEPTLVRTLVTLLSEEHEVVGATSGADALGILLGTADFDLVLCDLMMPYLTGMDLYERLARERPGLERRLVFMTGGAFTPRARSFLRRVPNPRFDKPFSPAVVTELVHTVIGHG